MKVYKAENKVFMLFDRYSRLQSLGLYHGSIYTAAKSTSVIWFIRPYKSNQ